MANVKGHKNTSENYLKEVEEPLIGSTHVKHCENAGAYIVSPPLKNCDNTCGVLRYKLNILKFTDKLIVGVNQ